MAGKSARAIVRELSRGPKTSSLQTVLYADAAGVSQVALLVAVAFWTLLWRPIGLLLATPLTVCVVVLGKHVPGLEFLSTLMADTPALTPDAAYYQRLLARDPSGASERIERHHTTEDPDTVYDALLRPALNYAERDRLEGRLSAGEEDIVIDTTRELMADLESPSRPAPETATADTRPAGDTTSGVQPSASISVLAYPVNGAADALALHMLDALLDADPITLEIASSAMVSTDLIAAVRQRPCDVLCFADLPPSPSSKTRYLVKKLHAALPELTIVVGRWAPPALADDNPRLLTDAGATHVSSSLVETRDVLRRLGQLPVPSCARRRHRSRQTCVQLVGGVSTRRKGVVAQTFASSNTVRERLAGFSACWLAA